MDEEVWRQLRGGEPGLRERWEGIRSHGSASDGRGPLSMGDVARLRKAFGAPVARFASIQDELGQRARRRFPDGRIGFWTLKGLEQATPAAVADYRAARFAGAEGPSIVWDACCGVGSDSVALLRRGCSVLATDWDADTARCAAANLRLEWDRLGPPAPQPSPRLLGALRCDLRRPPIRPDALSAAFVLLDPDRRPDGEHREPSPDRWAPSLSATLTLARAAGGACVKLPPSLDATASGLDPASGTATSLEWISLDGEMKELALWAGALAHHAAGGADGEGPGVARTATALVQGYEPAHYSSTAVHRALPDPSPLAAVSAGKWLVELDPTLWQSELAGDFCHAHGLAPIETELRGMYLLAEEAPKSPLARSWPILDAMKADRKRVRAALREHGIGPTTVKKRNHPKTSAQLEAEFKGEGDHPGLLAAFRVPSGSAAVILGPGGLRRGLADDSTRQPADEPADKPAR